ncbi:ABC transporter ATP-binding protein [Candidatus Uhrbacteria bacterium CG_4_9_14_3_um_filter_50_9]|uniref:ABC transporter ATP-binding protein n=1 Tax=Candidatus Uhrbacteria bacterium CG_4_9_14_3_um_filter_50_9 TaxID=1975035 RepID=A0A2M7XEX9_9BACT|nr:MAG: ABC transporter ATP-binding protein [Candidatus Uhrbacteria bacterium CG_4_9_14_3_um_filter_50_9]
MRRTTHHIHTKEILQVYWKHMRPYLWVVCIILALVVAAKSLDVVAPLFYKRFFDLLSGEIPAVSEELPALLRGTILIVLILHLFNWIAWRLFALFSNWFQPRVMADLRQTAFSYLHHHSYRFFSNSFSGSLVRRVNRLADSFEALVDQMVFNIIPLFVIVVGNLIVLWTRSSMLALILLGWVVLYIVINVLFATWKTKYDFSRAELDSETTGVLADSLTNAVTVKLFTGHAFESGLFKNVTERLRRMHTFTWNIGEAMEAVQALLMTLIEFVIMYYAIGLWYEGVLTVGDFVLIQTYLMGLFMVLWNVGRAIRKLYEALANADEMIEILNTPHEVKDVRNAKELQVQTGRIEFQNVYFSFNKTRRILKDMNLVIKPKEKIALVGPSGAGKSTITKLLFRFFDVERGKILVGNQNIAKVTQDSLRENIALVPQEPILFHRTIMDNIRYGRRGATDEEVIEAAKRAHAHEFIEGLQEGYETFVGERGVKLSGGERQRVAIARAILKNAPILVLDEATSSLDSESEALIQEALEELMKDKTTIVIAHRLSTIMKMDRIIVIEDGKVTDSGTHKQLLKKKDNIYKKLWEIQAGGFIK